MFCERSKDTYDELDFGMGYALHVSLVQRDKSLSWHEIWLYSNLWRLEYLFLVT